MHACTCMHAHTHINAHTHTHTHIHRHTNTHTASPRLGKGPFTCIFKYFQTCIFKYFQIFPNLYFQIFPNSRLACLEEENLNRWAQLVEASSETIPARYSLSDSVDHLIYSSVFFLFNVTVWEKSQHLCLKCVHGGACVYVCVNAVFVCCVIYRLLRDFSLRFSARLRFSALFFFFFVSPLFYMICFLALSSCLFFFSSSSASFFLTFSKTSFFCLFFCLFKKRPFDSYFLRRGKRHFTFMWPWNNEPVCVKDLFVNNYRLCVLKVSFSDFVCLLLFGTSLACFQTKSRAGHLVMLSLGNSIFSCHRTCSTANWRCVCAPPSPGIIVIYHWQELPQVSFLSRRKFCHDKRVLSRQTFCHGKHTFVTTKMIFVATPANDSYYHLHHETIIGMAQFCRSHIFVC